MAAPTGRLTGTEGAAALSGDLLDAVMDAAVAAAGPPPGLAQPDPADWLAGKAVAAAEYRAGYEAALNLQPRLHGEGRWAAGYRAGLVEHTRRTVAAGRLDRHTSARERRQYLAAPPPVAAVDDRCGDRKCWTGIGATWVEYEGRRWHRYCLPLPVAAADRLPTSRLEDAGVS